MRATHINVAQAESGSWLVSRGTRRLPVRAFRLKAHAMAFGRALAFNRHVEMIVHDLDGRSTRHQRASLTYPTSLD